MPKPLKESSVRFSSGEMGDMPNLKGDILWSAPKNQMNIDLRKAASPRPSIFDALFGKPFPGRSNRRENVFCSRFGFYSRNVKW